MGTFITLDERYRKNDGQVVIDIDYLNLKLLANGEFFVVKLVYRWGSFYY